MKKLYLIGKGGHFRSVFEIASSNLTSVSIVSLSIEEFRLSYSKLLLEDAGFHIAVGDVKLRNNLFKHMIDSNMPVVSLVSRNSQIAKDSLIERGSVIMHNAVIRTGARIFQNTIINTGAIIEHDSVVGKSCNISPGALICGSCQIGNQVFIGAGAVIIDGISICDNTVVGAGAVVIKNIENPGVYVGNPATRINE